MKWKLQDSVLGDLECPDTKKTKTSVPGMVTSVLCTAWVYLNRSAVYLIIYFYKQYLVVFISLISLLGIFANVTQAKVI